MSQLGRFRPPVHGGALAFAVALSVWWSPGNVDAQPFSPPPADTREAPTASPEPGEATNAATVEELRRLREESLRDQDDMRRVQEELIRLRQHQDALQKQLERARPPGHATPKGVPSGVPTPYHSGAFGPTKAERPDAEDHPVVRARYGYNHDATGPLGGGGFFGASTANDEYSIKLSSQITLDGTFFNHNGLPTNEQGFNIPFARLFVYGNITKRLSYQVGVQGFLGTFNLLDVFFAWHVFEHLTLRFGKGLMPPLYEYYAFSPALEPVITNSPLFQLAAKRPIGVVLTGATHHEHLSWWAGASNGGASLFGNLDNNIDFNAAFDVNPFRGPRWKGQVLEGLGAGLGFSVGKQRYALTQSSIAFTNNGEATTNPSFVTVVGLPFYVYNDNVSADGLRYRVAPHLYWFGRFSALGEYMFHQRQLSDGSAGSKSRQHAYYVNASFWLTGERDFRGTGFQGYATVEPKRPLAHGARGPGAFQLAAQWSQFFAGQGDINRGLVDSERSTDNMDNLMVGLNWWPNKYVRSSINYVRTWFNHAIPLRSNGGDLDGYQTAWMRFAMFF